MFLSNIFFIIVVGWIISQPCLIDALQERHHFYYRFTVLSKAEIFPDFTAESVADDRRMSHYNHETKDWMVMTLIEYPVIEGLEEPYDPRDWYKDQLKILSNCTQCSELHVLQRIIGCKLEKFPNGTVQSLHVFDEYGFDGNDLMAFNYDTMQWIDKSPNAKEIKKDWDRHTDRKQDLHQYLKHCMDWISKFNNTNKNSPDVYIFARKAPDDHSKLVLICLVTGFYPRDIEMNIRLNRINIESQISSGIRPNDNETFQLRSSVKIDRNHRGSYDCHVIHSSLTEPVTVEWDGKCFDCETTTSPVIVGALLGTIIALVFGVYCYKKRRSNALGRIPHNYGAMSEQIPMTSAACADASDQEITVDGSAD